MLGYAGMTTVLLFSLKNQFPKLLWRIIVSIILLHVLMVWNFRYEWQILLAVRNGYAGFLIFHSALIMILISTFLNQKFSLLIVRISFIVVSIGAIGVTFRYAAVEVYKIPVIILSVIGLSSLAINIFSSRRLKI
jgi:hypothetical protein